MNDFKNAGECIGYSKCAINQFSSLTEIIEPKDYNIWTNKLNKCSNIQDFLFGATSKLNLLNLSILIGFSLNKSLNDSLFAHYKMLFKKVEIYLKSFPELKSSKSFKSKIKNIEDLNFLSTLSELSLAYQLKEFGLIVKFESKFEHLKTGKNRDVDISASDKNNNEIHIEVYMPNKQSEINGFFDLTQEDSHFGRKVSYKLIDKFGQDGISGLTGVILLAINKVFFDMLHVRTVLPFFSNGYEYLTRIIPQNIDGLLIYEDGFESENSFRFEKIILKTPCNT